MLELMLPEAHNLARRQWPVRIFLSRDTTMRRSLFAVAAIVPWLAGNVLAHEFLETDVTISCDVAEAGGTLTVADHDDSKEACVVIVGGTLSHSRDGQMIRKGAPNRDALRRLAHALAASGYSSLRYDKV